MPAEKILVAMDDSEASRRLLTVVAARAHESETVRLVLCHVSPPLPPELLESRGAEDPSEEKNIEDGQEIKQRKWTDERVAEGKRLVTESKRALRSLGVPADRVETRVTEPIDSHEKLADAIVEEARAVGCGTIAVGHHSFSALREVLQTHLGDALRRRAGGLDVWIVD